MMIDADKDVTTRVPPPPHIQTPPRQRSLTRRSRSLRRTTTRTARGSPHWNWRHSERLERFQEKGVAMDLHSSSRISDYLLTKISSSSILKDSGRLEPRSKKLPIDPSNANANFMSKKRQIDVGLPLFFKGSRPYCFLTSRRQYARVC